jgi:hypothetical protein
MGLYDGCLELYAYISPHCFRVKGIVLTFNNLKKEISSLDFGYGWDSAQVSLKDHKSAKGVCISKVIIKNYQFGNLLQDECKSKCGFYLSNFNNTKWKTLDDASIIIDKHDDYDYNKNREKQTFQISVQNNVFKNSIADLKKWFNEDIHFEWIMPISSTYDLFCRSSRTLYYNLEQMRCIDKYESEAKILLNFLKISDLVQIIIHLTHNNDNDYDRYQFVHEPIVIKTTKPIALITYLNYRLCWNGK